MHNAGADLMGFCADFMGFRADLTGFFFWDLGISEPPGQILVGISGFFGIALNSPASSAVNNAGVGMVGPLESASGPQVQRVFDTNVFGVLRLAQALLPQMKRRRSGHIVVVSSVMGLQGETPKTPQNPTPTPQNSGPPPLKTPRDPKSLP